MGKWVALLLIAGGVGWWFSSQGQLSADLFPPQLFGQEPSSVNDGPTATAILTHSRLRHFDTDGHLKSIIEAPESRHLQIDPRHTSESDFTLLNSPSLTLFEPSKQPWHAASSSAKSQHQGSLIQLFDEVELWRNDSLGQKSALTTDYLAIHPQQQFAETDKPVTIRSATEVTHATGMRAYLDQGRFQLLSDVRGTYEARPHNKPPTRSE